ncbi:hypothetical protein [Lentzea atacamensis]|uniref:hypothetical protein n=1 Tax=Lentzea atacamensis TaxID=531938 RepID=UPI000DD483AE|nr:hypothetical protein [Lentzea atacamensis]
MKVHDAQFDDLAFIGRTSLYSVLSFCARMRGHGAQALRLAREGSSKTSENPLVFDTIALASLACAAALCGDDDLARKALARAEKAHRPAWRVIGTTVPEPVRGCSPPQATSAARPTRRWRPPTSAPSWACTAAKPWLCTTPPVSASTRRCVWRPSRPPWTTR